MTRLKPSRLAAPHTGCAAAGLAVHRHALGDAVRDVGCRCAHHRLVDQRPSGALDQMLPGTAATALLNPSRI